MVLKEAINVCVVSLIDVVWIGCFDDSYGI